jgi:hypothetical protein
MSKEQIEEIFNIITTDCDGECVGCEFENDEWCFTHYVSARLYNAGYRKQLEGEWVFNRGRTYGEPAYYCSACSEGASEYGYDKFCPNCGAKMKGGAE